SARFDRPADSYASLACQADHSGETIMAKGYLVDVELRCVRFRMPGSSRNIRCSISFNPLAQSFGAPLASQAEDAFVQHRQSIDQIAQRRVSGGRPVDADGWMWIRTADCSPRLETELKL